MAVKERSRGAPTKRLLPGLRPRWVTRGHCSRAVPGSKKGAMSRILPFLLLALGGCVTTAREPPLSVQQVVEQAEALDGREITVSGWIHECRPRGCALYGSRKDVDNDSSFFLSIGPSAWFDEWAEEYGSRRITFRARLDAFCIIDDPRPDIIRVCADRAPTLQPIRVVG